MCVCMQHSKRDELKGRERRQKREQRKRKGSFHLLSIGVTEPEDHLPSWLTLTFLSIYTIN